MMNKTKLAHNDSSSLMHLTTTADRKLLT